VEHTADARFIAGQSRAVTELMSGRANLPVTSWAPEAVDGYRGRPTLLSNAETWAHVGRLLHVGETEYRSLGTAAEPGTALLTFSRTGFVPEVREVPFGTRMVDVLPPFAHEATALLGGFHGAWTSWETLADTRVSVGGAGIVHLLGPGACPLVFTSAVVDYLAGQSAGKCGPCINGLPALAEAVRGAVLGIDVADRIDQLSQLLHRRGACAHPDGTVRMVRSMFTALPDEIDAHRQGSCAAGSPHRQAVAS
jgi:NADH:ubiquinone oxidoreductase subunit F (NADH-binding)